MDKKTPQAVIMKKIKSKSLNFMPVSVVIIYVRSYTLLCNSYRDIHFNYGYTLEVISLYFSYL